MSFPDLLTTDEMAAKLRKTPKAFLKWAQRRHLAGYRNGNKTTLWLPSAVWNELTQAEHVRRQPKK